MKNLFLGILLMVLFSGAALGQVTEQDMQMAAPDARHERLKMLEGEWATTSSFYMAPGQPMTGTGTGSNRMILGGRFIELKGISEFMGMKFESLTIMGFDKRTDKYTLIGFDELGTYYVEAEGDYNESTKVFSLEGTYVEPTSKMNQRYKFIFDVSAPNVMKYSVVFYDMPGMPAEFTMVEGTYTK